MEHDGCIDLLTLQKQVREGLGELFPGSVWVCAELSSIQLRSNGHCYMDLVQSDKGVQKAKAKAIIWSSNYVMISRFFREATGSDLSAGQQIMVCVQVNYSELYGLSLIVLDINPEFTVGDAQLTRSRTIARLESEGLMDMQKSLSLPALPYRLAVISAPDAAGYGDFKRHLEENEFGFVFRTMLFPATMQGADAPRSIISALEEAAFICEAPAFDPDTGEETEDPFDAVLILRGGGSSLDLACFDDYELCVAIARCPLPVFTAIGHDRDYHVADMVSYRFVKTPTALADEFIDCFAAEDERITSLRTRLGMAFIYRTGQMLSQLETLSARIHSANPRNLLERGYTLVTDSSGRVVKSAASVGKGETVRIMFKDGTIDAKTF